MKYFNENSFPYKFVLAGSLLGVKLKRFKKSFPVGKVRIEYMYPMCFKEFLVAIGKEKFIPIIENCYKNNKKMSDEFHEELMSDYRTYLCIGGMPKMVQEYLDNNNILQKNGLITLQNITDSYIADMSKYTNNNYESVKIERVYKNIPSQLAKENKKYQISKLEKNARLRDYMSSIDWLLASKLIIPCYYVNKFETPLKAYQDDTNFKIYLSDAGLLTESLYIPYSKIILDEDFMFKGAISENYVACELIKKSINLYYYYESQVIKIDFLIDTKDGVIPIEVKAGNHTAYKSLNKYMEAYKPKYAIRISSKNFGFENNIKSIPLYAVFCIDK